MDGEVKALMDRSYTEAREILNLHRDQLDKVTAELLKQETLDGETFLKLIGRPGPPQPRPGPQPGHLAPA
jgi:cell division protease FtsH